MARLHDPAVRTQIETAYASLLHRAANTSEPKGELGKAYGDMGRLLFAAEYYEAAEPCFLNAQALAADDFRWPYFLGRIYRLTGDPQRAAQAFERAHTLRPDDPPTMVWLANAYLDQGNHEASIPIFERALATPARAPALFGLGRAALAAQDYRQAVERFEQTLALDSQASVVRYPLAMAYRGLGEAAKAEAALQQRGEVDVALTDPLMRELGELLETASAYERRAMRASADGDWPAAVDYLQRGVELAPADPLLRNKLGIALVNNGDPQRALTQFERAAAASPGFADADLNMGLVLADQGRHDEALARFRSAAHSAPDRLQIRFELAEALRREGQAREALSHYSYVLDTDPNMIEARYGYALALVALRRYDEARRRLAADAERFPERPEFAQALARLASLADRQR